MNTPDTLGSFVVIDDVSSMTSVDRSTIENYATCPFMAWSLETGAALMPEYVHVGTEVHDAISRATLFWMEGDDPPSPGQLKETLMTELRGSRPDLQPKVLAACARSAWSWACILAGTNSTPPIHPVNVLAFDGGEKLGKTGQLAHDFEDLRVRITSEIDLLYQGAAQKLLHEIDYKAGYEWHREADVRDAFQFDLHAMLVFENYPDVEALSIQIFDTRFDHLTYEVYKQRTRLKDYTSRVRSAVQSWATHRHDNPPAWPGDKCYTCPAAALCPVVGYPLNEADPTALLRDLIAVNARSDALKKALTAHVDKTKTDVVVGSTCFGREKPKSTRKSPTSMYALKAPKDNGSTE